MDKIRVHELAKELKITSKELLKILKDLKIKAASHMSSLDPKVASTVKKTIASKPAKKVKAKPRKAPIKPKEKPAAVPPPAETKPVATKPRPKPITPEPPKEEKPKTIQIPHTISVGDLATKINISATEIIKLLMKEGLMISINQNINFEKAKQIAAKYGWQVNLQIISEDKISLTLEEKEKLSLRPPVVTVLGHVDHGKTSLLDAIRQTNIVDKEKGGITQKIGASTVESNGKEIIFIDTPGHEAFTSMRARGAKVTDIVVLVIAADDGIKPQTIEAIDHAKAAKVPIITAINKIDKPQANIEKTKQQLSDFGLVPEDWGGKTICIPVSAKQKTGISDLLEMILLVAEMQELKADPKGKSVGTIIEAKLDKGLGPVATVIVQNGTLKIGDIVIAGLISGRIRAMINDKQQRVEVATPSVPVEIIGLESVPQAGDILEVVSSEKETRQIIQTRKEKFKANSLATSRAHLETLYKQMKEGEFKELNLIIKADEHGSAEALSDSLSILRGENIRINIIHTGVGSITESDVLLATASNAIIIGFNIKPDFNIKKIADQENIDIRSYNVIYDVTEDIKQAMVGMLKPEYKEVIVGKAEVKTIFKISKVGVIAGSYVTEGKILRNLDIKVVRDGKLIHKGKINSLKRFKDDVKEVSAGFECGIGIEKFADIKPKDIIEFYELQEIKKSGAIISEQPEIR